MLYTTDNEFVRTGKLVIVSHQCGHNDSPLVCWCVGSDYWLLRQSHTWLFLYIELNVN